MSWLFIVATNDAETVFNAARLANASIKKGKEVNMFMLGKGVEYEQIGTPEFDVNGQLAEFDQLGGNFLV
ncbi:hypothetical protein [Desulfurivibrio dismutans]|uniref:hypothetical protein n=1 Tax=Desulfurivibrio dismutans TaxID=1398908 RepID=UPI0030C5C978|nr:hypothetical protein [Desulfurivibrio alkaliphilus]